MFYRKNRVSAITIRYVVSNSVAGGDRIVTDIILGIVSTELCCIATICSIESIIASTANERIVPTSTHQHISSIIADDDIRIGTAKSIFNDSAKCNTKVMGTIIEVVYSSNTTISK